MVRRLEDPVRISRRRVHFIPPAQTDKTATSDVFEVVEVCRQEEDGNYEDQDALRGDMS
jgi:hypothetical protein